MVVALKLYRDLLQAPIAMANVSGFRNVRQQLRLAHRVSATISCARSAIGVNGWYYQSVEEHQGCCDDE